MTAAFSPATRQAAHARDSWCVSCGGHQNLQLQHRRARGMGSTKRAGSAAAANALVLCQACHGWAESHPGDAAFLGWRVTQFDDPTHVPVWRSTPLGGEWVLLDDDGGASPAPDSALAALAALHAEHLTRRTA